MGIEWTDWHERLEPDTWIGVKAVVPEGHRPGLQVHLAGSPEGPPSERVLRGRLSSPHRPFLWYAVEDCLSPARGEYILPRTEQPLGVIPHLHARDIEAARRARDRGADLRAWWAHRLARSLGASPASPIGPGLWTARARTVPADNYRQRWADLLQEDARRTALIEEDRYFTDRRALHLRPLSEEHAGRVKWYRKLLREGLMPPVVSWWFSGCYTSLLLDGHDRMIAAFAEGVDLEVLEFERRHEEDMPDTHREYMERAAARFLATDPLDVRVDRVRGPQHRVRTLNRLLLDAHMPWLQGTPNRSAGIIPYEEWATGARDAAGDQARDLSLCWQATPPEQTPSWYATPPDA